MRIDFESSIVDLDLSEFPADGPRQGCRPRFVIWIWYSAKKNKLAGRTLTLEGAVKLAETKMRESSEGLYLYVMDWANPEEPKMVWDNIEGFNPVDKRRVLRRLSL